MSMCRRCGTAWDLNGGKTASTVALDLFKLIISSTCKQKSEFLILTSFKS